MSDVVTLALRTAPAGALELAAVTPDRLAQLASGRSRRSRCATAGAPRR